MASGNRHRAKTDQFAPELVYFSRCILEGRDPEPSGQQGRADVRILDAMMRSARAGAKVHLAPIGIAPARTARWR